MPGRATAVSSGKVLRDVVAELGLALGLEVKIEVKVGRRIWGSVRNIDVVMIHPITRLSLGLECKFQSSGGSAEEKIPSTIQDIEAWPIRGLVVFSGEGFSDRMRAYLYSTGKAVDLEDLPAWLELYFGL